MTVMTKSFVPSKPKMIILEGVDRSGKGSLHEAIDKLTKYKHFVMDRGPIGFKAYCDIFEKGNELFDLYTEMENNLSKIPNVLVIYIDCETEELIRRCKETNHEIIDYSTHKYFYEVNYGESPLEKVRVNTTKMSAEEIVQKLIDMGLL